MAIESRSSTRVFGGVLSIQAMAWAIEQQQITEPVTRFVLLCLANYAGSDGNAACPSVLRLARDTGLSERAIRSHLRKLEAAGIILRGNQAFAAVKIKDPRYRPVVYNIVTARGASDAPLAVKGGTPRPQGVHATQSRGAPRAPNPKDLSEGEPKSVKKRTWEEEYRERFGHPPPANLIKRVPR